MGKYLRIVVFILFSSCGLRITNYVDDNVLIGSWKMDKIVCYSSGLTTIIEQYELTSDMSAQVDFQRADFSYSLSSNTCSTSATALYVTEFEGDRRDTLLLKDVISGQACSINLNDSGPNATGTVDVVFDLYAPNAKDLYWNIDTINEVDVLSLQMFTTFQGSSSAGGCGSKPCTCLIDYKKI